MEVKAVQFPELDEEGKGIRIGESTLSDIPIEVKAELGKSKLTLREILEIAEGSIIELDRLAGEPLDLKVGGSVIAQGEVVAIDDNYGIRITNVLLK
ncbi:flagellar motor switch protein FliN [candidate division WOR-1 bacterium RIFOXYC2_FULL_37_10]|uniref:Flagellar motor switch protein FliN n=1 Tax=candidate division WOR-1 bacterium RIFOXYB2_FULL_37_13 TaxID=1802579 RepID=A0A1F4SM01_UNCSA|nr:MAG: flagellar motor switch protein FliN [candidate division WOR-1 bacterium RIFOXYB2_FULL_37_13]OGC33461.1 MAG: flagellar motor switch protein FliN [candidate division WOR-1 bacterium RIFOXYC2_FULL_37_10]